MSFNKVGGGITKKIDNKKEKTWEYKVISKNNERKKREKLLASSLNTNE